MYAVVVKDWKMSPRGVRREPIIAPQRERRALARIGEALAPRKRGAARLRGPRGEEMIIPRSLYALCGNGAPRAIRAPDLQIRSHLVPIARSTTYLECGPLGVHRGGACSPAAAPRPEGKRPDTGCDADL
jgi:hypothetical protein